MQLAGRTLPFPRVPCRRTVNGSKDRRPAAHRAAGDHDAGGRGRRRADVPGHEAARRARRELRRPRRRIRGPAGHRDRAQSVRQQPRRRTRPHRPDRELADGDLHEEGQEVRHNRQGALRPRRDEQRLQGLWRHVRVSQQRRCRRALRPARRPLAHRHADLQARRRPAGPTGRVEARRRASQPARPAGTARSRGGALPAAAARPANRGRPGGSARPERPAGGQPRAAGSAGTVLDVLRGERRPRSVRAVLPLRVPAAAFPGLPAAGHLARRLLRPDEHR